MHQKLAASDGKDVARLTKRAVWYSMLAAALTIALLIAVLFAWFHSEFRRAYGDPELVRAAAMGDAPRVRSLLQRGAPVESYHLEGSSALWWAVASGSRETVQALLEHGADPNSSGQWATVIETAAGSIDLDDGKPRRAIATLILDQAPRIKDPTQLQLLRAALAKKPAGGSPAQSPNRR